MARLACEDKLLQIFFIGLKLLSTTLAKPVRGPQVDSVLINKALKKFAPILIQKIQELNARARDISIYTLLSIFRHPDADLSVLIESCLDICNFYKMVLSNPY